MRAAEIFERWRAAREGAPAELSPVVPGPRFEAGTLGNANKSGLSPLSPVVPAGIEQGCIDGARACAGGAEAASLACDVPEAAPAPGTEAADDAAPEPLPFRLAAWGDAADAPRPGDACGTCSRRSPRGGRWWREAVAPKGWRCARCHPADHVPEAERFEALT